MSGINGMNGNNHHGRIIAPGQLNVTLQNVAGPLAEPATLQVPAADGIKVITFGGLTKVEMLAGMIIGHVKEPSVAVEMAQAVLDECEKQRVTAREVSEAKEKSSDS
jgi:hypothetical protein